MGGNPSILAPRLLTNTISLSSYIDILESVEFEKVIQDSRFLKSVQCRDDRNGGEQVLVKLFIKPDRLQTATAGGEEYCGRDAELTMWMGLLDRQRRLLSDVAGVMPYSKFLETERAGYMVRQYLHSNLYDRLSTRPFLEHTEKLWVVFQLVRVLDQCHRRHVTHGDMKSENILVTTWNSVYLTDFSPYKPVYLPEDNPGEFFFYFDTSQRRNCYLAPERFQSVAAAVLKDADAAGVDGSSEALKKMDVFSLGCVIAEVFLEGGSIFTLSQLFKYKRKTYVPNLSSIGDCRVRQLVQSMILLDAADRKSAGEYLQEYRGSLFPETFYTFVGDYVDNLVRFADGEHSNGEHSNGDVHLEKMFADYPSISLALGITYSIDSTSDSSLGYPLFPLSFNLPGIPAGYVMKRTSQVTVQSIVLVFLGIVLAAVRNTQVAASRIKGIELLVALCERVHDEAKLDRGLPFLVSLLDDECPEVRTHALKAVAQLVSMVDTVTPINVLVFPEYIIPKLRTYLTRDRCSAYEKMCFAAVLPCLALHTIRFFDLGQVLKTSSLMLSAPPDLDSEEPAPVSDLSKSYLVQLIELFTLLVLTADETTRIAFLSNIHVLCAVLGKDKTNDIILSHLITYLNDKSPHLRLAFVRSIVGISVYVGGVALEQYILPLLVQSLSDPEEFIVVQVLHNFTLLVRLDLVRKHHLWDLVDNISTLLLHPNEWIRQAALAFVIAVSNKLSLADVFCTLYPVIRPYLDYDVTEFTWNSLYPCAKKPVSRSVYRLSFTWHRRATNSAFWKQDPLAAPPSKPDSPGMPLKLLTAEDKSWVKKLVAAGLLDSDLWKVYALRDHIAKAARSETVKTTPAEIVTEIQKLGVFPRSVFLDIVFKPSGDFSSKTERNTINLTEKTRSDNESVFSGMSLQNIAAPHPTTLGPTMADDTGLLFVALKKATPSLLTNQENIYGELDNQNMLTSSLNDAAIGNDSLLPLSPIITHSYTGNNKNILKFLNNYNFTTTLDNFYEFGPPIALAELTAGPPKGILVAHLLEHDGAVNCLATSPDGSYFLSGSEDGHVKIWDSLRLERNVSSKSSLSVNLKSPVKNICFIENRDCFAASTKLAVKIFRVSFAKGKENKVNKLVLIRSYKFSKPGEYATHMRFAIVEAKPLLIMISSLSQIVALDVRTMKVEFVLQNTLTYGVTTAFCTDSKGTWILVGTSKGYLTLWDLRFTLNLKTWRFPQGHAIKKLGSSFNTYKHSFFTVMSDNNGLSIYDISKGKLLEIYTTSKSQGNVPVEIDDDQVDFEYDDDNLLLAKLFNFDELENTLDLQKLNAQNERQQESHNMSAFAELKVPTGSHKKQLYLFSSNASNHNILFWDVFHPNNSKPVNAKQSEPKRRKSRSTLISSEQKDAIRNHYDVITDMTLLVKPYFMVVTGDRSGVINVYK